MEIYEMDASTLAEKIRKREITSVEATEAFIERIEKVNPAINALVENRFQEAREEAAACDKLLESGKKPEGKLFGVPISVKECFDVKGMHTTAGIPSWKEKTITEDAKVIRLLKKEGAIILGKTNTPVLSYCQETDNLLYGRTNNPWNLDRTCGGSSGGEGALIAAGGAAVGLGTDFGGSIRFPSHFNGTVGFKPGALAVSEEGMEPILPHPAQKRMVGIGPIAKSVQDAKLVYEIVSEQKLDQVDLKDFEIVIPRNINDLQMEDYTLEALKEVENNLSSFKIADNELPYLKEANDWWLKIMCWDGGKDLVNQVSDGSFKKLFSSKEIHKYFKRAMMTAVTVRSLMMSDKKWEQLQKDVEAAKEEVDKYLEKRILVLPVYHSAAPEHGKVFQEMFSATMSYKKYMPPVSFVNCFGLPSLIIPIKENKDGLPVGIQFITTQKQEAALFELGSQLEKNVRGYRVANL